jgi:hypothetical protein
MSTHELVTAPSVENDVHVQGSFGSAREPRLVEHRRQVGWPRYVPSSSASPFSPLKPPPGPDISGRDEGSCRPRHVRVESGKRWRPRPSLDGRHSGRVELVDKLS